MMNEKRQVVFTDAEISKNNRLCLLMDVHKKRQPQQTTIDVEKQECASSKDVKKQVTEEKMGKQLGTCEQCGKEKTRLTKHFNKEVCPSCTAMRGFVKNKPEVVVAAMQEFHGAQFFTAPGDESGGAAARLLFLDRIYGILEAGGVSGWDENTSDHDLCETLKEHVLGLRNEVGRARLNVPVGVDSGEYFAALEQAYALEHEQLQNADRECVVTGELWDIVVQVLAFTAPGVDATVEHIDDHLASLPEQIRKLYADQERHAQKAVVVASVRDHLNIDPAVPDERIVGILHNLLLDATRKPDHAFAGEIAAHLGMESISPKELIEGVANLSMALGQAQLTCHDLTQANIQQRERLNELTQTMTANSIVNQVEGAGGKDGHLLDLALAALRGDTEVVADKLELMRGHAA